MSTTERRAAADDTSTADEIAKSYVQYSSAKRDTVRYRCLRCKKELRADEQPCPYCGHKGRAITMVVNENINVEE
jgi:rRNA maturation endonuclease Nob1